MNLLFSTGLSDIVSFFNNYSTSGDVDGALVSSAVIFKIVMWLIIFVGAIAMAVWIGRIAIDILLLVTRGTKIADSKLRDFGTGKEAASSVKDYVAKNGLEIVLMIVLITFLMTGWLFRLVAVALSGFGALGNKLFDLDISSKFSTTEVSSYVSQVGARRATVLKSEYDELLGNLRTESQRLYDFAKKGTAKTDAAYAKAMQMYTHYLYRAQAVGATLSTQASALNMQATYFDQHLSQKGQQVCNKNFVDSTVEAAYIAASVKSVTCK